MNNEIAATLTDIKLHRDVKRCLNYSEAAFTETLPLIQWAGDNRYHGHRAKLLAKLDYQIEINSAISECAHNGQLSVIVWARDCDHMEVEYCQQITASWVALNRLEGSIAANAEGPYRLSIINHDEALDFKASKFDRAAYNAGY